MNLKKEYKRKKFFAPNHIYDEDTLKHLKIQK